MTAFALDAAPLLQLRLPQFNRVSITLVGAGGTGSHIASGLPALVLALEARGAPATLQFIDPDSVEEKNVGRQLFSRADVGKPKAAVLAGRLNAAYGLDIGSAVRRIDERDTFRSPSHDALNIVIGAVDNRAGRATLAKAVAAGRGELFALDCGNENQSGQVLLGNQANRKWLEGSTGLGMVDRLPSPYIVMPDLVGQPAESKIKKNGHAAADLSCAELAAAGEQGLMVNRMMAAWALAMLHDLLLGTLSYFAVWVNLGSGGVRTWPLDLPSLSEATGLSPRELEHHEAKAEARRR